MKSAGINIMNNVLKTVQTNSINKTASPVIKQLNQYYEVYLKITNKTAAIR